MIRAEFHAHTLYSKDSLAPLEAVLAACRKKQVDRIAITDHNTIRGALLAREMDPERVIIGEEIMTEAGELLAFFVSDEIPPGLPPLEAIERLRVQGAFISVSHPFDVARHGHWAPPDLEQITPWVDAIEGFNARCLQASSNRQANEYAIRHHLAQTVGSDAHMPSEIGAATLLLPPFQDAGELRQSLQQAQPQVKLSSPWVHFYSMYAKWVKKRRASSLAEAPR